MLQQCVPEGQDPLRPEGSHPRVGVCCESLAEFQKIRDCTHKCLAGLQQRELRRRQIVSVHPIELAADMLLRNLNSFGFGRPKLTENCTDRTL